MILRRSVFSEITEVDLRKTIILNAKALIERDADFAKFAARILLTYVYEEVLGWDVAHQSIEEIRTFHAKEFKSYLHNAGWRSRGWIRNCSSSILTALPGN